MPRDKYCVLLVLCPKYSVVTYLDSGREDKPKDYTNLKKALDNALVGFSMRGGVFKRKRKGRGGIVSFHHIVNFACVTQPKNSERDAYYAIHQIRAFVRDADQLKLPEQLKRWAENLATIQDLDLRQEFYRIQETFARIILHDVCTVGGKFYYDGAPLDNAEVERRLKAQGDIRPFTIDGVRPFPAPKTVDA